jgi:hypothetical protein
MHNSCALAERFPIAAWVWVAPGSEDGVFGDQEALLVGLLCTPGLKLFAFPLP